MNEALERLGLGVEEHILLHDLSEALHDAPLELRAQDDAG